MKLVLPLVLGLAGLAAGIGTGMMMYVPEAAPEGDAKAKEGGVDAKKSETNDPALAADAGKDADQPDDVNVDYIKLSNQFVVPLVSEGKVVSLVVLSLSLEVDPGNEELVYSREPKLRDAFLRVLFDHANAGGFSGDFTRSSNMIVLRDSLHEIARKTLGDMIRSVLIVDLVRQDS